MPAASQPDAGPGRHPGRDAVADVVRDVVAGEAPEELPLAQALILAGGSRAARSLLRRRRPREPLGFGIGEVAVLVTPVVWIAVDEAVRRSVDGTLGGIWRRLGRWRHRGRRAAVPPLTRGQLAQVRERVLELAAQAGLDGQRSDVLADRVVARLALSQDTPGSPESPGSKDRAGEVPGAGGAEGPTAGPGAGGALA